jgi:thiol-disulfide isomerase/thioredoxin
MPRGRRLLGWILVAGAALAALAIFGLASNRSATAGRAAPELPRERLGGRPITLAGLLAASRGRSAVVVFWASWCGPCEREAPALERFSVSAAGRGRIVGIDWSDALSGAQSFIRHYAWTFPNMRDAEGTTGSQYQLTGLPSTFVLDGRGRIRKVLRGPQTEGSLNSALTAVEHA